MQREADRCRERQTDVETDMQKETDVERGRHVETDRCRRRQTDVETDRYRERQTDRPDEAYSCFSQFCQQTQNGTSQTIFLFTFH